VNAIRPAASADLEAIAGVERICFERPWTERQISNEIDLPAAQLWVLEDASGAVIGFAALRQVSDESELLRIALLPAHRRRGEARRLLDKVLREAARGGAERCHLEVDSRNLAAIALYRDAGFAQSGARRAYYETGDALLFTRALAP